MDWLSQTFSSAVQWTGDTAKSAGSAISNGASVAWNKTTDAASSAWDATKQTASDAWDGTKDAASATWDATKTAAGAVADTGAAVQSGFQVGKAMVGLGPDKAMTKFPGKVDYASFGSYPSVEQVRDAPKVNGRQPPITVTLPFERGAQGAAPAATSQTGDGATVQAPEVSFVYLDVGRWGGTKDSPTRDFGIVCGGTAAICAFTQGSAGSYKSFPGAKTALAATDGPDNEVGPINKLLHMLSGSALGTPQVRNSLSAKTPRTANPKNIYIILGDMHLPAVTGPEPVEQQELHTKRVGRARRSDALKDSDVMSDSDASLWHEKYIAAEIFQEAGPDLSTLFDMLQLARGNVGADLWLLQLGDMFDLWLGFDCFLVSNPHSDSKLPGEDGVVETTNTPVRPDPVLLPSAAKIPEFSSPNPTTAISFIETWVNRTMQSTTQGQYVQRFLGYEKSYARFLHGNHDNYLATHVPSLLSNMTGGQSPSEYTDDDVLFYACHGHQFDKYNRDGAITGNFTTQAAFWGGQGPRKLEGLVDSRTDTVLGVVALRKKVKPFNVFAMGHTHTALLAEIVVKMEPEPLPMPDIPIGP